jgi:hypothetical protein
MDEEIGETHDAAWKNTVLEIKSPRLSYIYAPTSLKINPTMKRIAEKIKSPVTRQLPYFLFTRRVSFYPYVPENREERARKRVKERNHRGVTNEHCQKCQAPVTRKRMAKTGEAPLLGA